MIRALNATQRGILEVLRDAKNPMRELRAVDIDATLAAKTMGAIRLGGAVYTFVRDLEREKLVESREDKTDPRVASVRGGRPIIYYAITAAGLERLK